METPPLSPDDPPVAGHNRWWLLPLLLGLVLGGMVLLRNPLANEPPLNSGATQPPSLQPAGKTVSLEIDYGNGVQLSFAALPWRAGMTVADVLEQARGFHPGLRYQQVGTGAGGLLTSIAGVANEGNRGRNWHFEVAGVPAQQSFCLEPVGEGELVRWWFTSLPEEL